uniref:Uncharacterized protein n=1 Tax=Magallana gigas TaxID=29159 RepID=K1P0P4_MAGGI
MGSERAPSFNVNVQVSYPADMWEDSPHWIGATAETTPWFKFSGCYVYEAVNEEEIKMLTEDSKFIGPVADCYLQCESHFGVNMVQVGLLETHCSDGSYFEDTPSPPTLLPIKLHPYIISPERGIPSDSSGLLFFFSSNGKP